MFRERRPGLSRTLWVVMLVLVLGVAAGEYLLQTKSEDGPKEIDITIVEENPVLQTDYFLPDDFVVTVGENVTLAILNNDDNVRVLTIPAFNINETMYSGEAIRIPLTVDKSGTYLFYSPKTPPNAVSQGRIGPCLNGTITATAAPTSTPPVNNASSFSSYLQSACDFFL